MCDSESAQRQAINQVFLELKAVKFIYASEKCVSLLSLRDDAYPMFELLKNATLIIFLS